VTSLLGWHHAARPVLGGSVAWRSKIAPKPKAPAPPAPVEFPTFAQVARACSVCTGPLPARSPGNKKVCSDACALSVKAARKSVARQKEADRRKVEASPAKPGLRPPGRCSACDDSIDRRLPAWVASCRDCLTPRETLRLAAERLEPGSLLGWIRSSLGLRSFEAPKPTIYAEETNWWNGGV
jgi:hypothetical protein